MELLEVCESLVHETDGVRACVVLDLKTSLTLTQCLERGFPPTDVARASRTAGGIFQGKLLRQFVRTLPGDRGPDGFVREAQVTTSTSHLFMSSLPKFPNALLLCVTDKSVNIGMGWMAVHQALDRLDEDSVERHAAGRQGEPRPVAEPDHREPPREPEAASPVPSATRPVNSRRREPEVRVEATPPARRLANRPAEEAEPVVPTVTARAPAQSPPKAAAPKPAEPEDPADREPTVEESKPAERPAVGRLSARGFFAPKPKQTN